MTTKLLPLIFVLSILLLTLGTSCEDNLGEGQRSTVKTSHDYDKTSSPGANASSDNAANNTLPNIDIRDIWQRPELVLNSLGDLEGKVVADIGAGPYGYFSLRIARDTKAKKVIAIDIDQDALGFIDNARRALLPENAQNRLETRLVSPSDPQLKNNEADIVLIVNTVVHIEDRIQYLKNLKTGLAPGGRLVIIDYKKKSNPMGLPIDMFIALGEVEADLRAAGYQLETSDDTTLEFQYIITATAAG
ncbi:MAG: class I SAM-dependent methyltransferase [Bacteroidota bacterium]